MIQRKEAGKFQISAARGGSPVWYTIDANLHNGDAAQFFGLQLEDLHDLRYLLDRMIAQEASK